MFSHPLQMVMILEMQSVQVYTGHMKKEPKHYAPNNRKNILCVRAHGESKCADDCVYVCASMWVCLRILLCVQIETLNSEQLTDETNT